VYKSLLHDYDDYSLMSCTESSIALCFGVEISSYYVPSNGVKLRLRLETGVVPMRVHPNLLKRAQNRRGRQIVVARFRIE
jgi:hypothetical protein